MSKVFNHIHAVCGSYAPSVALVSIEVTAPPTRIEYSFDEAFDPTGMVVTAAYSDGTSAPVTEYTVSYEFAEWGWNAVSISYTEGDVTADTGLSVFVDTAGTVSALPEQDLTLTYTGESQSPTWTGYDPAKLTISGVQQGTAAGSYTVTFTPTEFYDWWDGTHEAKTATWTIGKAKGTPVVNAQSISLNSDSLTFALSVSRANAGPGTISVVSSDAAKCTVTDVDATNKTITGIANGSANIEIYVAESTNYLESYHVIIPVTVSLAPISKTLNDYTWAEISAISAAGTAEDYFEIGDCKAVYINGTVGTSAISGTYYAFIIGFDHNASLEGCGISFGLAKSALTNGVDVALTDGKYGVNSNNGTKYFNMNHSSGRGNSGGWQYCDMRFDILGSAVDDGDGGFAPLSATYIQTPYTLMSALPNDLRAVMKPITKYTDNTGGTETSAENVTATADYLPLMSVYEVLGTRGLANSAEKNYQQQYAYYAANPTAKYKYSDNTTECHYLTRSPEGGSAGNFVRIDEEGEYERCSAYATSAISPVFLV